MSKVKTFLVSDDSVNSYGFRVLSSGIDTKNFDKNPVMLSMHQRSVTGPIGKWTGKQLLKEGLHYDPVFDMKDPVGSVISQKVKDGFMKAASIGLKIVATSDDPKLMLPGQKYFTVTKSELMEISVVDIPSNKNALALYDADDNLINLDDTASLTACLGAGLSHTPAPSQEGNITTTKTNSHTPMKFKILAAWASLLTFLNLKVEDGKDHIETELSETQLADINVRLGKLALAEADLVSLKKEKDDLDKKLQDTLTELAGANERIKKLTAPAEPPAKPVLKDGEETLDATKAKKESFLTEVDEEFAQLKGKTAEAVA